MPDQDQNPFDARRLAAIRVGVIDDNRHMGQIVAQLMRSFGIIHTEVLNDATAALKACDAVSYDLLIADYHMPTIDGLDFTRLIRKSASSRNTLTPIILVTAYTEKWRVVAARDAGVTEVCVKPISGRELWRKLAAIVNEPRPFIRAGDFFGPDRRRKFEIVSADRRQEETERTADRAEARAASEAEAGTMAA